MSGRQLDPAAIAPEVRAILDFPETVQANEIQYSLVNFVPVTRPLLDAIDVGEIVEIGVARDAKICRRRMPGLSTN